jgi:hypothetical protein
MVLAGYNRDPGTGETVWIVKNSWGVGWGDQGYGFVKVPLNDIYLTFGLRTPMLSLLTPYSVACRDADGDGYFNWGVSSDASAACGNVPPVKDCDDSNPALALMTDAGVCTAPPQAEKVVDDLVNFVARPGRRLASTEGCTISGESNVFAGKYTFDATLKNVSTKMLFNPAVEVAELTNGNRLQNADGGPTGNRLTVAQSMLAPGQSTSVRFVLCLRTYDPFRFRVNVLSVEQ